jgi:hypothetical protein
MPVVKLPYGGVALTTGTRSEANRIQLIVDARYAFSKKYCQEHGWPLDAAELSIEQIMEIRGQEGWKNPIFGN